MPPSWTRLEDLAYGIETGQERYVDKSLAAMTWLFPEGQGGGLIGK